MSTIPASEAARYAYSVTGYAGFEEKILRLRNANRSSRQTRAFLDWRYSQAQEDGGQPQVFWLDDSTDVVGMASLVPRIYWVDGVAEDVGVLGDISVDAAQRGRGLGKRLLEFMTKYCEREHATRANFVIPTEVAGRVLAALGWGKGGRLVQHVLLLSPHDNLQRRFGDSSLTRLASQSYRGLIRVMLWLKASRGHQLQFSRQFDAAFEDFWRSFPKQGLWIADRSLATLRWRYTSHPHQQFRIARLMGGAGMAGYLVFEISGAECMIYDVLALSQPYLNRMLAMFTGQMMDEGIKAIRVTLNDAHPYRPIFRWMGFISRHDPAIFQFHDPPARPPRGKLTCVLTQADKDI